MKVLLQSHYPQRSENLPIIINDILANGIGPEDIVVMLDYPVEDPLRIGLDNNQTMYSSLSMPINWWHGVGSVLETDYVALINDDLTILPNTLTTCLEVAKEHPEIDVFGLEGDKFAKTDSPYTDSRSHTTDTFEKVEYVIRFYFAKPVAFAKALLLHHKLPKEIQGHDDLVLSLANTCGLIPTTDECGTLDLPTHNVAFSNRPTHYDERNKLVWKVRNGRI